MSTPKLNAPEWQPSQASPWLTVNEAERIFDAFGARAIIVDRDLAAPPVNCDDGDCFLVAFGASGEWLGHVGEMAIAVGEDASNGWLFATVERLGVQLYIEDEDIVVFWNGVEFEIFESARTLAQLSDVSIVNPQDGDMLLYEGSSGQWHNVQPFFNSPIESVIVALGDETSDIEAAASAVTIRMPYAFNLLAVRASVNLASSSGDLQFDINENGVSILSTKLTIDEDETSSVSAAVQPVISDANLADDSEITFDVDIPGTGAKGAKIYLIGRRGL